MDCSGPPGHDPAHPEVPASVDAIGRKIVGASIRVHRALGPGCLESVYRRCLAHALRQDGLSVREEVWVALEFEGLRVEKALRVDLLVEECVLVELKATEALHPVHQAQLVSYLRLTGLPLGYLLNFHANRLVDGLKRFAFTRVQS